MTFALAFALLRCLLGASAATEPGRDQLELRGRIVCLAEEMQRLHRAPVPAKHEHLLGFKTIEGKYYTLLRTKTSDALFADKRLHGMELILTGRFFPEGNLFDSSHMRSVKDGKQYDLFYYCDICAIEAVTPEECQCCREPVRLVERLIER